MKGNWNMLKNIKAVIFDLDGSLVDSMWMWKQIDIEYFAKYGLDMPDTLQKDIEGMSFTEVAHYFKTSFDFPVSEEEMKNEWNQMAWDKYINEVPLKNGADKFLTFCKENNIALGIATSNSKELVTAVCKSLGIEKYFSCIMTACEVQKGKPAPDIYLAVAKKLNVLPEQCLVFEDIIPGIMAGKNAGMKVCAVEDAYSAYQKNDKLKTADYYINDFHEIDLTL